ncbi:MAG: hypothetical protein Q8R91_05125 [Candidatus Omnitrophota bacterium]|nr:hypothetical protein [Candidatus Omnitrophota bacterium]
MSFTTWLQGWLTRHPLREPSDGERARYTAEVMARVEALRPSAAPRDGLARWAKQQVVGWPRLALAMATAAAGVALLVGPIHQRWLAQRVVRDAAVLASLGEAMAEPLVIDDDESLREALEELDALVVAEASSIDDSQWIAQTLELLGQLEEWPPGGDLDPSSGAEEWIDELELLDESDLNA